MSSPSTSSPAPTPRTDRAPAGARRKKPWWRSFGVQVTAALVLGVVVGVIARQLGPGGPDAEPNGLTATLDTIGGAYVYDTAHAPPTATAAATERPLVNWDVVATKWNGLAARARTEWTRLAG